MDANMLTTETTQAYSSHIASTDVIGIGLLSKAANSRSALSNVAFLRLVSSVMDGLGGEPQGSPVRFPGSPTRPVPSTRLDSGVRLNQLNESERIMTGNQLIPVFTGILNNESTQLCNARDLHGFLQIGKDFSTWIKARINQYGFSEGEDYKNFDSPNLGNQKSKRGGDRRSIEYHLTLDMAKELAMVENNEQGKAARRYFIELERKLIHESTAGTSLATANEVSQLVTQDTKEFLVVRSRFDPEITAKGERVTTTSLEVARGFKKNHDYLLKRIEALDCSQEFFAYNFELIKTKSVHNQKPKHYEMTKDGFIFLVMGFTGVDIARLKETYIRRFNALEQAIIEQQMDKLISLAPSPVLLPPPDKFTPNLRRRVTQKAHELSVAQYDVIHDLIHNHIKRSLENGASESSCEDYIEQFGNSASGVTLINTYQLYLLARRITNQFDEAGNVLALIHQLEEQTGLQLYSRKGDLPIKESLVEELFNHLKKRRNHE